MVCFVHFDLEMCFAPQRHALFRHLNLQKWSVHGVFCAFWLRNVLRATTACTFSSSQLPKVVREWCVLYILTSKCASRHNGAHFCNISTSKSGPRMVCFVHFDFEMCFAPQRRALFRHRNFQKWSEPLVFLTFWLPNVLRATKAYNFSSLIWPAGSAPAALASLLFDPPEPQIIGKTQCFATFLPFRASASAFFWLFLFYSSFFWSFSSLCLFPALLFICPYCRKFDFETSFDYIFCSTFSVSQVFDTFHDFTMGSHQLFNNFVIFCHVGIVLTAVFQHISSLYRGFSSVSSTYFIIWAWFFLSCWTMLILFDHFTIGFHEFCPHNFKRSPLF